MEDIALAELLALVAVEDVRLRGIEVVHLHEHLLNQILYLLDRRIPIDALLRHCVPLFGRSCADAHRYCLVVHILGNTLCVRTSTFAGLIESFLDSVCYLIKRKRLDRTVALANVLNFHT